VERHGAAGETAAEGDMIGARFATRCGLGTVFVLAVATAALAEEPAAPTPQALDAQAATASQPAPSEQAPAQQAPGQQVPPSPEPGIRFGNLYPRPDIGGVPASALDPRMTQSLRRDVPPPPAPVTNPSPFTPHLGFDMGGSSDATLGAVGRPANVQNSDDPNRHYKAQAGIDYDVSSKIQMGLGYRYSNYERPSLVLAPSPDTELERQDREQAAMFSLRYRFGAPNKD
jgi:hypothetical protein